jgi:hypothetical protein
VKDGGVERRSCGVDVRPLGAERRLSGVPEHSLDSVVTANGAHRIRFGGHRHKRGARRLGKGAPEQCNGRVVQADRMGERRHGGHRRDRGEGLSDRGPALRRVGCDRIGNGDVAPPSEGDEQRLGGQERSCGVPALSLGEPSSRTDLTCCSTDWRNRPLAVTQRSPEGSSGPLVSWSSPLERSGGLTMSWIGAPKGVFGIRTPRSVPKRGQKNEQIVRQSDVHLRIETDRPTYSRRRSAGWRDGDVLRSSVTGRIVPQLEQVLRPRAAASSAGPWQAGSPSPDDA